MPIYLFASLKIWSELTLLSGAVGQSMLRPIKGRLVAGGLLSLVLAGLVPEGVTSLYCIQLVWRICPRRQLANN